jgi:5-formyltetrahydrofolate cyclo-ligase
LELIIVPALTYDRMGYRLGYGGGYYDRYLLNIPAFTVGMARERLVRDALPRESHDVAMKCLATEKGCEFVAQQPR